MTPISPGLTTTTLATCGSRSATIAHAPPETSNATRSSGPRLVASAASASGELSTRPPSAPCPPRRSRPHRNHDARLTRSLCPALAPHTTSPDRHWENWWANDNDGYALAAQRGQSQGRPSKKHGLTAHRPKRPAHNVPQESPRARITDHYATRPGLRLNRFSCPEQRARRLPR